jgi:hypothetical protein
MQSTSQPPREPGSPSTDPVSPPEPPNPCQEQLNALEEAIVQFENAQKLIQERADALLDCRIRTAQILLTSPSQSVAHCNRVKGIVGNCSDTMNHTAHTLRRTFNLW